MPVSPYNHLPPYGEYTRTTRINDDNSKASNVQFNFYYNHRYVDKARSIGFYNQDSAVSSGYNDIQGNESHDKGYLGYISAYQEGDGSGSQYYYKVVTPADVDEKIAAAIDGALEEDY